MALRAIRLLGDEVLRTRAVEVEPGDPELADLVDDMFETMYAAEGAGLAAPQVGVSMRVFVVDVRDTTSDPSARFALVNPSVVTTSKEEEADVEGCLSIPGVEETVTRPTAVSVRGLSLSGAPVEIQAEGLLARVLQHEIDHLDGVLFIDHLSPLKRRMLLQRYRKLRAEEEREAAGR